MTGSAKSKIKLRHAECDVLEPFMPLPSKVGRPREVEMREVWNAIQHMAEGGGPRGYDAGKK